MLTFHPELTITAVVLCFKFHRKEKIILDKQQKIMSLSILDLEDNFAQSDLQMGNIMQFVIVYST